MTIRPSVPEIITVNSESLQTQIRDLLPSQRGFGSELQATNVITPIIDLTSAAEGSSIGTSLQQALAFGSQTAFEVVNTTTVIANSPGFYRVTAILCCTDNVSNVAAGFLMDDGAATKQVYAHVGTGNVQDSVAVPVDLIFWLDTGISLSAFSEHSGDVVVGSIRQVADSTGTLVNPNGFPL